MEGKKINRWTVGKYLYNQQNHSFYECTCDCGTIKPVSGNYLRKGTSKSCGCYDTDRKRELSIESKKREPFRIKLSSIHHSMMQRCHVPGTASHHNYGARGISVCKEWMNVVSFRRWAMSNGYKPGLDLNRIDNNGGYNPSNCNFVTRKENMNNTRMTRWISINGQNMTMSQIADKLHKPYGWVKMKLKTKNGLSIISEAIEMTRA